MRLLARLVVGIVLFSVPALGQSPTINGDFDGDGVAGPKDLLQMIQGFGQPVSAGSGNLLWAKRAYSQKIDSANDVALGSGGEVFVTGQWTEGIIFGEGEATQTILNSETSNAYVARYNSDGSFVWVRTPSGGSVVSDGIAVRQTDHSVYATGRFTSTATFWNTGAPQLMATSQGSGDTFLLRATADGDLEDLRDAGGGGYDEASVVDVLPDGTHIQMGLLEDTVVFGEGDSTVTLESVMNDRNPFLVKYNPDGSPAWGRVIQVNLFADLFDAALLPDGRVAVTGVFDDPLTLGSGETNETVLNPAGGDDAFLALFNSDGTLAWARSDGGMQDDEGLGVTVLPDDGGLVFCGRFEDVATFGAGTPAERLLTSTENTDIFIAKYDLGGNLVWAKRAGGFGSNRPSRVAATPEGGAVVVGSFQETCAFGTGEPNETSLVSEGMNDAFVAKYEASGGLLWAKRMGGLENDAAASVAVHSDGTSVVVGQFRVVATFGEDEPGETVLDAEGINNFPNPSIFVAKFGP
ncbi:MAG: hypothetical protein KC917_05720 [Candidatus Omnitrophica bacterium]|nr:hypothetical protein [Candidatus Omnitrophota bacterium]